MCRQAIEAAKKVMEEAPQELDKGIEFADVAHNSAPSSGPTQESGMIACLGGINEQLTERTQDILIWESA